MTENREKLSLWTKLGYGVGDIYGGGVMVVISFFYMVFLTDVVGLSPWLAGIVFIISKFYDAITDPFEGVLSDRTRTTLGRRRPYLIAGIPLVFLSFFLLFYPIALESEVGRFAFVVFTYLFFSTVVSIVMLNYNALQSELTLDYNERTALTTSRIFFSTVSSILCALLPLEIVKAFADVQTGWMVMGVSFGLLFALPFIATVAVTRERPEFQKPPQPFQLRHAFIEPFLTRTFVFILVMYVTAFAAFDTVMSIVVYYIKNYLGRGEDTSFVLGALLIFQVISLPFYQWYSKRTSKPRAYILGAVAFVVVMFSSLFITPSMHWLVIFIFAALVGLGSGGVVMMVYSIFPDIPDVDELKSGERREGIYSAMSTFTRKLASGIAGFVVAMTLQAAGYIKPVEQAGKLIEQPQSDEFILILRVVFAILPVALISFGIFFASRFPLTVDRYARLEKILAAMRNNEPVDEAEKQELTKVLLG